MGELTLNLFRIAIPAIGETFVTQFITDRLNLRGVDIKLHTGPLFDNELRTADIIILTANPEAPTEVTVHVKCIRIKRQIGQFQKFTTFFQNILPDELRLEVLANQTSDEFVNYDIFVSTIDTGVASDKDLYVITLEAPEGQTAPSLPTLPNNSDPIAVKAVLRSVAGGTNTYDYFMLSNQ